MFLMMRLLEMFLMMRIMGMLMVRNVTEVTAGWGLQERGDVHHGGLSGAALLTESRCQHKIVLK